MPGSIAHLGRRFFDVLSAQPLAPDESSALERWLGPELAQVFLDQPAADQRHGYEAARTVTGAGVVDREVVMAALLHDVGKRHTGLGIVGRSIASILIRLGLPLPERFRLYRDHGVTAALELAELGAPTLVVEFARHHHGSRPDSIDERTWALLQAADRPAKAGRWSRARITSSAR